MYFFIDGLKVIRRRTTNTNPCKEEFIQHDEMIKRQLVEKLGCYPPYWSAIRKFPACTNPQDLRALLTTTLRGLNSTFLINFEPPCDQILTNDENLDVHFPSFNNQILHDFSSI